MEGCGRVMGLGGGEEPMRGMGTDHVTLYWPMRGLEEKKNKFSKSEKKNFQLSGRFLKKM